MYKNIRIKKKGGGFRTQRVKVLASGKYKFVKNSSRSRSTRTKTRRKSNPIRRKKTTARRRRYYPRRRRRSRKMTIPLAPIGGLLATPAMNYMIGELMAGNLQAAIKQPARFAGIDPNTGQFNMSELTSNLGPLVLGLLVHKFVGGRPLNLNATLGRAGVPLIRI